MAQRAVPLEILGSSPGSVAAGRDRETHGAAHNWPSVVRVRGGVWPGRDVLVPSRSSDSSGRPGAVHADTVARCTAFPPTHWCGLASGLSGRCAKKRCGLVVFRRTHGSQPSPLPSPYGSCRDETVNYQTTVITPKLNLEKCVIETTTI